MNNWKVILAYIPYIGLLVTYGCLCLPYSIFEQVVLIITGVSYVTDYLINKRWQQWQFTPDKWPWAACIVLFMLFPIWILLGIETGPDKHVYLEAFLPFLIFGAIGIAGLNEQFRVEGFALVGLSMVSIISLYLFAHTDLKQVFGMVHEVENPFNLLRAKTIATHMQFNLFANISIVFGYLALRQKRLHRGLKMVLLLELIITAIAIFVSEGRTGPMTLVTIGLFIIVYHLFQRSHRYAYLFALIGVVICCTLGTQVIQEHNVPIQQEPRPYLWNVSLQQIQDRPILGYGPSSGHNEFVRRCQLDEKVEQYYLPTLCWDHPEQKDEFIQLAHPHNLFLEMCIDYGIIGLVLIIFIIQAPIFLVSKSKRFPVFLCAYAFLIQAMFEHLGNDLNPMVLFVALAVITAPQYHSTNVSGTRNQSIGRG